MLFSNLLCKLSTMVLKIYKWSKDELTNKIYLPIALIFDKLKF